MYIYLTTNLINKKIYIGKRELDWSKSLSYYGSGKYLKNAIKLYDKINFKKELICECSNKEYLCKMERFFIDYYDSTNPEIGYNIGFGGEGFSGKHNNETKNKISNSLIGRIPTKEQCKKISIKSNERFKNKENHGPMYGKHHTEISKLKISILSSGTNNGMYGKHHTEDSKTKSSQSHLGIKQSQETINKRIKKLKGIPKTERHNKLNSLSNKLVWAKKKNDLERVNELEIEILKLKEVK